MALDEGVGGASGSLMAFLDAVNLKVVLMQYFKTLLFSSY